MKRWHGPATAAIPLFEEALDKLLGVDTDDDNTEDG